MTDLSSAMKHFAILTRQETLPAFHEKGPEQPLYGNHALRNRGLRPLGILERS